MSELLAHDPASHIAAFRADLIAGRPWTEALLAAIAAWDVTEEEVAGREYRYLVGGEAFDWLVLAERLVDAVDTALLPALEVEALLLDEQWPQPMTEEAFQQALGPSKSRAHLNFIYGVRVEEALQLAVEEHVRKERGNASFRHDGTHEGDAFQRIYGASRSSLLHDFRKASGRAMVDRISLTELKGVHLLALQATAGRAGPGARRQRHAARPAADPCAGGVATPAAAGGGRDRTGGGGDRRDRDAGRLIRRGRPARPGRSPAERSPRC